MLNFEYPRLNETQPTCKGQVNTKNPYQLAGHRFDRIKVWGDYRLTNDHEVQNLRNWFVVIQGCIMVGGQRKSQPVGSITVKANIGRDHALVEVQAELKCADDCIRLGDMIEKELREIAALPEYRVGEAATTNFVKPTQRTLSDALQQAVPIPAGKGIRSILEGINGNLDEVVDLGKQQMEAAHEIGGKILATRLFPGEPWQTFDPSKSKMVQHAKREMELAGMYSPDMPYGEGAIATNVLELVTLVASQGHSGGSLDQLLLVFDQLIRRKPLTPVTNNPAEWADVQEYGANDDMRYQNLRDSGCFSGDGGKTYWKLDESVSNRDQNRTPKNVSKQVEPTGPYSIGLG